MIRSFIKRGLKKVLGKEDTAPQPTPYPFKYEPSAETAPAPAPEPVVEAAPEPAPEPVVEVAPEPEPVPEPAVETAPEFDELGGPIMADGLPQELSFLTVKELRDALKERGVELKSRELKTDLIKKLSLARAAGGVEEDAPFEGPTLDTAVVQELLDEMVRPALQGDGGDIALVKIEGMDVHVRLVGACTTCPSSIMTMKMGVEALFKEEFPGFGELIQVD